MVTVDLSVFGIRSYRFLQIVVLVIFGLVDCIVSRWMIIDWQPKEHVWERVRRGRCVWIFFVSRFVYRRLTNLRWECNSERDFWCARNRGRFWDFAAHYFLLRWLCEKNVCPSPLARKCASHFWCERFVTCFVAKCFIYLFLRVLLFFTQPW